MKRCQHCRGPADPTGRLDAWKLARRVYCGVPCHDAARRAARPAPRPCARCGGPIPTDRPPSVTARRSFCGDACRGAALRLPRPKVRCATCGRRFEGRRSRASRYCDRACYLRRPR